MPIASITQAYGGSGAGGSEVGGGRRHRAERGMMCRRSMSNGSMRKERTTMSLAGRVAIVTGAGHGIGSATALALADAGADVACVDIDEGAARDTTAGVGGLGRKSAVHQDRRRRSREHRRDGPPGRRHLRPGRHPREQRGRHPARLHHGPDRGGLGPHHARERQGRVLLPPARGARDDPAAQRRRSSTSRRSPARASRAPRTPSTPRARAG